MDDFVAVQVSSDDEPWAPADFMLRLKPQQGLSTCGDGAHATVDLRIRFGRDYPHAVPEVGLENARGISLKDVDVLKRQIGEVCSGRVGEEVVFILAHHVQGFLAEKDKRPRFRSFHDEMLFTHQKSAMEEKCRKVREDELELNIFKEEIQKKQMDLRRFLGDDGEYETQREQHPLLEINLSPSSPAATDSTISGTLSNVAC